MTAPVPAGHPGPPGVERRTAEVSVTVQLDLDGTGDGGSDTGLPFLDHMLAQLGKHARFDLRVEAKGDLEVDAHHTVEDTGITIGQALAEALGDKSGVRRFGDAVVPLDEAGDSRAVDLSGRPTWSGTSRSTPPRPARQLRPAPGPPPAGGAGRQRPLHHPRPAGGRRPAPSCLEACFKALARALGDACAPDPRAGAGSTKGSSDDPAAGGRARLRGREPPLGGQGPGPGRRRRPGGADGRGRRRGGRAGRPGVGAYGACLNGLASAGGADAVAGWLARGRPCSASASACSCCSRQARKARSATASGSSRARSGLTGNVKIPHIGWDESPVRPGSRLLAGLGDGTRFYFVHSYAPEPDGDAVAAVCDYGGRFGAAVEQGNLFGTQFHPEKSGKAGLALLANFVTQVGAA